MAEGEGGSFFGPGKKRMSKETFKAYLFWAIAIDIIFGWWLPGAGTVFVGVCYGTWWLHGYNIDKLGTKAGISAVCGFVPFLELVSNIVFVCVAYADNVKNTAASELGIAANKPEDEKTPGADNLLRQNNGDTQGTSVQGRDASNQKTDNLVRKIKTKL